MTGIDLNRVLTLNEAAARWKLADGATIRKAIERKRFKAHEIRKSGSIWLISLDGMERVFGPEPEGGNHK
ncbi:MAG: helix-turn-helix domain-containing protein [Actinobacteria bacterium]|nr:helix-turn-helix domain-containing protein [Actinomycetota bacterium]